MQILLREERDLTAQAADGVVLDRAPDEIRGGEGRDRDGREYGSRDRQPETPVERDQASRVAATSRRR
jgi:hypothetical protein